MIQTAPDRSHQGVQYIGTIDWLQNPTDGGLGQRHGDNGQSTWLEGFRGRFGIIITQVQWETQTRRSLTQQFRIGHCHDLRRAFLLGQLDRHIGTDTGRFARGNNNPGDQWS